MGTLIFTSIIDLVFWLGEAFELAVSDAREAAERIQSRPDRPAYGDDWRAYVDALTPEDVHSLYGEDDDA